MGQGNFENISRVSLPCHGAMSVSEDSEDLKTHRFIGKLVEGTWHCSIFMCTVHVNKCISAKPG